MKIKILGSGTSHGIPVIACNCDVCNSNLPENKRTRSSILISDNNTNILIDCSPDLRNQALRESLNIIDLVLITHSHADHVHGIDDLRSFSYKKKIPLLASKFDIKEIKNRFKYIFKKTQKGGGKPKLDLQIIKKNEEKLFNGFKIQALPLKHGKLNVFGYKINKLAYLTDCSFIPEETFSLLEDIDLLIIDALRYRKHSTHFSIEQAIKASNRINPKQTLFTHICHEVEHNTLLNELPKKIKPAFDGLFIEI